MARARHRRRPGRARLRADRHDRRRARQPHVVVPLARSRERLARARRGGSGRLARGGRRPARDGLLGALLAATHPGSAHRRPRRSRRAARHPGSCRHHRSRLGRTRLARLGRRAPRSPRRRRRAQHRRPSPRWCGAPLRPARRHGPRHARCRDDGHHGVPRHHPGPGRARSRGEGRLPRPVRDRRTAPRHRRFRRRHPRDPRPREHPGPAPHVVGPARTHRARPASARP